MGCEAGRLDLLRLIELVSATALPALLLTSGVLLKLTGAVGKVVTAVLSTGCRVEFLVVFDTFVDLFRLSPGELPSALLGLALVSLSLLVLRLRIGLGVVVVFIVTAARNNIRARFLG